MKVINTRCKQMTFKQQEIHFLIYINVKVVYPHLQGPIFITVFKSPSTTNDLFTSHTTNMIWGIVKISLYSTFHFTLIAVNTSPDYSL